MVKWVTRAQDCCDSCDLMSGAVFCHGYADCQRSRELKSIQVMADNQQAFRLLWAWLPQSNNDNQGPSVVSGEDLEAV
jgi:hypothetical protein